MNPECDTWGRLVILTMGYPNIAFIEPLSVTIILFIKSYEESTKKVANNITIERKDAWATSLEPVITSFLH